MAIKYHRLKVLVADDFSSFRNTVNGMLTGLGVATIDMASSAQETINYCQSHFYDVVLCDYNLGPGRTGQHVLEELRYRDIIGRETLFIVVSAEASRNIVMSAFDCEPDDYLMKPITGKMLETRMERLLKQREILLPVHKALKAGDTGSAVDVLIDLSIAENRYSTTAQKMLGELFIRSGDLDKAEKLYTRTLEVRQLDWARLGLAKVKQLRGELDVAGAWLEKIVAESPLYLPAYDVLADNWDRKGETHNVQFTVQRSVDISPMSILRQVRLADAAKTNNDISTSLTAMRRAVKLGELSCHGKVENNFEFARTAALSVERKLDIDPGISKEALTVLEHAKDRFSLSEAQMAQCNLLSGRLHALENRLDIAQQFLEAAAELFEDQDLGIDADVERVAALLTLGKKVDADRLLKELQQKYADDEPALEKLDQFLNEPASESNRELVAAVNREGIDLYNSGKFDQALACFERARKLFPKHIGIQLNIVQALIGKLKMGSKDKLVANECQASLDLVETLIDDDHPQFDRYKKLRVMAKSA